MFVELYWGRSCARLGGYKRGTLVGCGLKSLRSVSRRSYQTQLVSTWKCCSQTRNMATLKWTIVLLVLAAVCCQAIAKPAQQTDDGDSSGSDEDSSDTQTDQSSDSSDETASAPAVISKPNFVCKPNCGAYAEEYEVKKFRADGCCTFIPCPGTNPYPTEYNRFKKRVCSKPAKCN